MIRVFGIGNILLCDDAIGVRVAEKLINKRFGKGIEVIVGETDYMYCLDKIDKDDFVVIIDSTYFNIAPGMVTKLDFKECDMYLDDSFSQHEENLIKVLRRDFNYINGCLIGIEIGSIDYSLDLSSELESRFKDICREVTSIIRKIERNMINA
ncbi:MAG: hydrogenase maturation protease [Clostridium sp.]